MLTDEQIATLTRLAMILEAGQAENGIDLARQATYAEALRALLSATQPAAVDREAVAWQVRRSDGRIDGVPIQWEQCTKDLYDATLSTGRYAGYENGPRCEVRALYAAPLDKDASKPVVAQGWTLTRQQHPADDECEAMDTILVQGPKGERHIAYDIPGVGHALYAFLDAMLAASTVAPSVEQDERGAFEAWWNSQGDDQEGWPMNEEGMRELWSIAWSAARAASTSANVAHGAPSVDEYENGVDEYLRVTAQKLSDMGYLWQAENLRRAVGFPVEDSQNQNANVAQGAEAVEGVPEGCTVADAKMLREANHALAIENELLRKRLRPFAHLVGTGELSWAMVEYCVKGDPEKQTFNAPQMQRAFNRAAEAYRNAAPPAQTALTVWQPIDTAPEGVTVVVGWFDPEDGNQCLDFDWLEDGIWQKHSEHYEWAYSVAPAGSRMPSERPPYTHWIELQDVPTAAQSASGDAK